MQKKKNLILSHYCLSQRRLSVKSPCGSQRTSTLRSPGFPTGAERLVIHTSKSAVFPIFG